MEHMRTGHCSVAILWNSEVATLQGFGYCRVSLYTFMYMHEVLKWH